jgi:hypothetical protein
LPCTDILPPALLPVLLAWGLLGVEEDLTLKLTNIFQRDGNAILTPGFSRISLPYYASDAEVAFVADAVAFVAEHGWKLLPQYVPNSRDGTWRHVNSQSLPSEMTLASIDYSSGQMRVDTTLSSEPPRQDALLAEALAHADAALEHLKLAGSAGDPEPKHDLAPEIEALRWFLMPWEAADLARGVTPKAESPFWPSLRDTIVPLLQKRMASYKEAKGSPPASSTSMKAAAKDKKRNAFPWRKERTSENRAPNKEVSAEPRGSPGENRLARH